MYCVSDDHVTVNGWYCKYYNINVYLRMYGLYCRRRISVLLKLLIIKKNVHLYSYFVT